MWQISSFEKKKVHELGSEKAKVAYNTASACINPITDGMGPDSWLPCKDLEMKTITIEGIVNKIHWSAHIKHSSGDSTKSVNYLIWGQISIYIFMKESQKLLRKYIQCGYLKETNVEWYLPSEMIVWQVPANQ